MIKRIDKSNPDYSLIDTLNEIIDVLNKIEKNKEIDKAIQGTNVLLYNATTLTCTCGLNNCFYCPLHPNVMH